MINGMGMDVRNLLKAAYEIAYFSRGGVQYDQVLKMTPLERDLAVDFINKRLEAAAKMPFPIF
jgi:hypothetical protein